jgi:hypothetical protein
MKEKNPFFAKLSSGVSVIIAIFRDFRQFSVNFWVWPIILPFAAIWAKFGMLKRLEYIFLYRQISSAKAIKICLHTYI